MEFTTHKKVEAEKNREKDGKVLYKLMSNAIYGKTIENFRSRINVKLENNKKDFKMYIKTKLYATQYIWLEISYNTKNKSCIKV